MSSIDVVSPEGSSMIMVHQFASQSFYQFCDKYRIQNVTLTAYNPATNGLAEAFNKIIIKLLKKFIFASKRDWNEKLSECL